MGPHKVGGAQARGLWYVTIRSVPVSHLHNSNETHGKNASHYLSDIFFNRLETVSEPMRISSFFFFLYIFAGSKTILCACNFNKHPLVDTFHLDSLLFSGLPGLCSFPLLHPEEYDLKKQYVMRIHDCS